MSAVSRNHRIVFLVRSLETGGAERQLVLLAKELQHRGLRPTVVTFYAGGAFRSELEDASVPVIALSKTGRWDVFGFLVRLAVTVWREHPTVLHAYLAVPNILAVTLRPFLPRTRIVWGLRASAIQFDRYHWLARATDRLEALLARWPDLIISNSHAGRTHAITRGYPAKRIVVIPNGIDTRRFQFDEEGRRRVRGEWHIRSDELLIGLVARLDPIKDQITFLEAVAKVRNALPSVRFACVGSGSNALANTLRSLAKRLELDDLGVWPGRRDDMPAVYSAFDIAVSSSVGEGFSNAIAEAMACQRPCVVTDVGDSRLIVGDTGAIVPAGDSNAMCSALLALARSCTDPSRQSLGPRARARIDEQFNVQHLVERSVEALVGHTPT